MSGRVELFMAAEISSGDRASGSERRERARCAGCLSPPSEWFDAFATFTGSWAIIYCALLSSRQEIATSTRGSKSRPKTSYRRAGKSVSASVFGNAQCYLFPSGQVAAFSSGRGGAQRTRIKRNEWYKLSLETGNVKTPVQPILWVIEFLCLSTLKMTRSSSHCGPKFTKIIFQPRRLCIGTNFSLIIVINTIVFLV